MYQVLIFGDRPGAVGDGTDGSLTAIHPEGGEYEMPLRTAKALVRKVERMGMFAAVVDESDTIVWVSE